MAEALNLTEKSKPAGPNVTIRTDSAIRPAPVARVQMFRADKRTDDPVKLMFYGDTGSGKTYVIIALLRLGLNVVYFSTEIGGSGLRTVKEIATEEELSHLFEIEGLTDYKSLTTFLNNPEELIPEFYDTDIDMIFWDGGSEAQLVHLEEYIGESIMPKDERSISDARRSGLQLEQRDWSMVMNGTVRMVKDFMSMQNQKTGKRWHKIMTFKESEKERVEDPTGSDAKPKFRAKNTMVIHGAAKKLVEGAFDFIVRARVKTSAVTKESEYLYCTLPSDSQTAKARGVKLPAEMPADMATLWAMLTRKKGT